MKRKLQKPVAVNIKYLRVAQCALNGAVLKIYESALQAGVQNGYNEGRIRRAAREGRIYHGFRWQFV